MTDERRDERMNERQPEDEGKQKEERLTDDRELKDAFRRKWAAYAKGELAGAELDAFEQELARLEAYQELLQENGDADGGGKENEARIVRRGKWKARFQTALTALALALAFTVASAILTAVYYSWGEPDRVHVYRNVIDHTLAVTDPYGYPGGTSTATKFFFGLEATRPLHIIVGKEQIEAGELTVHFLFSLATRTEAHMYGRISRSVPAFYALGGAHAAMSDWDRLEALPEGTVASAYVSFDRLMETQDVLDAFADKNLDLLWLAVDTGGADGDPHAGVANPPLGFPRYPIWHDDDFTVTEESERRVGFGGKIVSRSAVSPAYEDNDAGVLQRQFMKTLKFLAGHERLVNRITAGRLRLAERMEYLERHGIRHHGAVITGPTKELLGLREEAWVAALKVDEVALWNWVPRE
ncbi:hypothetical protein Theco_3629 [Thermobacillus composti KWC4]|uniref:Sigma factor regulator C-terminal domain-containing protein n=2 Tax=Thermobacillus TaxID=76632 RepID=L0EIK5_THECK|nr:hypothetical protein Theco_3629 [Thermobacillus composti KWC4]